MNPKNAPVHPPAESAVAMPAPQDRPASATPPVTAGAGPEAGASRPKLPEGFLATILHEPARWRLIRVLAKDEPLPVNALAARIGKSPNSTTQYLKVMVRYGLAVKEHRHNYRLTPAFRPAPGDTHIDLGDWLLRL